GNGRLRKVWGWAGADLPGTQLTGGTGHDTFILDAFDSGFIGKADALLDFETGDLGDTIDLTLTLSKLSAYAGTSITDPFHDGYLRLIANGTDTDLQLSPNANGVW